MPGQLYIPAKVKQAIAEHIAVAVAKATDAYASGAEEEDVLTGQLGVLLRINNQHVDVDDPEAPGTWTWSIEYYKFRGRGGKATENILGADGIFELRLIGQKYDNTKTLLFQAKNDWDHDASLLAQAIKLSTWREAACIINFRPESIEAYNLDTVVDSRGKKGATTVGSPLADYLGKRYLDCEVGDTELLYYAPKRLLKWRDMDNNDVVTSFAVKERIRVNVLAPKRQEFDETRLQSVPTTEVHNHRMYVNSRDMLGLSYNATPKQEKTAVRQIARTWHPDPLIAILNKIDPELIEIVNRRSQETNELAEVINTDHQRRQQAPYNPQERSSSTTPPANRDHNSEPEVIN